METLRKSLAVPVLFSSERLISAVPLGGSLPACLLCLEGNSLPCDLISLEKKKVDFFFNYSLQFVQLLYMEMMTFKLHGFQNWRYNQVSLEYVLCSNLGNILSESTKISDIGTLLDGQGHFRPIS